MGPPRNASDYCDCYCLGRNEFNRNIVASLSRDIYRRHPADRRRPPSPLGAGWCHKNKFSLSVRGYCRAEQSRRPIVPHVLLWNGSKADCTTTHVVNFVLTHGSVDGSVVWYSIKSNQIKFIWDIVQHKQANNSEKKELSTGHKGRINLH